MYIIKRNQQTYENSKLNNKYHHMYQYRRDTSGLKKLFKMLINMALQFWIDYLRQLLEDQIARNFKIRNP